MKTTCRLAEGVALPTCVAILDASDAVTADGRVATTNIRGDEIEVTIVE
jgi:hypothetical protein